jgi:hypothetical protein
MVHIDPKLFPGAHNRSSDHSISLNAKKMFPADILLHYVLSKVKLQRDADGELVYEDTGGKIAAWINDEIRKIRLKGSWVRRAHTNQKAF